MRITKHITELKDGLGTYLNSLNLNESDSDGVTIEEKGTIGLKLSYDTAMDLYKLLCSLNEFRCRKAVNRNEALIFYPHDYEERIKGEIIDSMVKTLYEQGYLRFYTWDNPGENLDTMGFIEGSIVVSRIGDDE